VSDRTGSRLIAAIVIKIAAGTKNRPIEKKPTRQHAHSSAAATTAARRVGRRTATSEIATGTDETNKIHHPLTENPVAYPHRIVPGTSAVHEV
jgi:hypothetical protein